MQTQPAIPEAEGLFLSALPVIDEVVGHVCRRKHCRADETEEFGSIVRLKLCEDHYAVLRQFAGRSNLRTFLSVVVLRLFFDFRRKQWGSWRPSAQAERLGSTAVRLDVLLHRDHMPLDQAIEVLRTNERVAESADLLRDWASRLPVHGRHSPERRGAHGDLQTSARRLVEDAAEADERDDRARRLRDALRAAMAALPPVDALILRMRACDGFRMAHIADVIGVPVKPLYRRLERLQDGLRAALRRQGFAAADFADVVGHPAFDDDDEPTAGRDESGADKTDPGPSTQSQDGHAARRGRPGERSS